MGGGLCAMIAAMPLVHQLHIEGPKPALRPAVLEGLEAFQTQARVLDDRDGRIVR